MCHLTKGRWPCCSEIDVVNVDMCTVARAWARTGSTRAFPCRKTTEVVDMGGWCWRCEAEIKERLEEAWKAQERGEAKEDGEEEKGAEEGEEGGKEKVEGKAEEEAKGETEGETEGEADVTEGEAEAKDGKGEEEQ